MQFALSAARCYWQRLGEAVLLTFRAMDSDSVRCLELTSSLSFIGMLGRQRAGDGLLSVLLEKSDYLNA